MELYPDAPAILVRRHGVYVWGSCTFLSLSIEANVTCREYLAASKDAVRVFGLPVRDGDKDDNGENTSYRGRMKRGLLLLSGSTTSLCIQSSITAKILVAAPCAGNSEVWATRRLLKQPSRDQHALVRRWPSPSRNSAACMRGGLTGRQTKSTQQGGSKCLAYAGLYAFFGGMSTVWKRILIDITR